MRSYHFVVKVTFFSFSTQNGKEKNYGAIKTVDNSIKSIWKVFGTGITLTNNEIKDVIKLTSEDRNFIKRNYTKIASQEGRFWNFLGPLMTAGLPLMKSVFTPLAKSALLPSGLLAGMSAEDAVIQKKIYVLGTTTLIISNEEM